MTSIAQVLQQRHPQICVLTSRATVSEAVALLATRECGALLVVQDGDLVGIFSERDLLRRVVAPGRDPGSTRVSDVMTAEVVTATPEEDRHSAVSKMRSAGCRHLPVVVDGTVIDVLSMKDLLFEEIEERSAEVDQLRHYISGAY
jgi:CBS domain-containing protein